MRPVTPLHDVRLALVAVANEPLVHFPQEQEREIERLNEALAEAKILLEQRDRRIVGLENRIAELEATADRQLELLKEWHKILLNKKRIGAQWDSYYEAMLRRVEQELSDAKTYMKGNLALSFESTEVRMGQLARSEMTYGRYYSFEEIVEHIDSVTMEDFRRVCDRVFRDKQFSLVSIGKLNSPSQEVRNLRI